MFFYFYTNSTGQLTHSSHAAAAAQYLLFIWLHVFFAGWNTLWRNTGYADALWNTLWNLLNLFVQGTLQSVTGRQPDFLLAYFSLI